MRRLSVASALFLALFGQTSRGQTYTISLFAGGGLPINTPGVSANIDWVSAVAADAAGNLFIASDSRNVVLRLDASTGVLTLAAGNGVAGFSGDGGPATSAQLNSPSGIAVDSAGNLYIADTFNSRVRKVSNGVITTVAGDGTSAFGGDYGPATSAQLNNPRGIAVDSTGNLYIADANGVRKVSEGVIATIARSRASSPPGDRDFNAVPLDSALAVAVDSAGNVYVVGNNRVFLLTPEAANRAR